MNPCVGDKVRVSRTILVSEVDTADHSVGSGVRWYPSSDWEIEVIEKAKPKLKVGDTISDSLYKDLPCGAVTVTPDEQFSISDGKGNLLVAATGQKLERPWVFRTLVFLP